jgi:hypothetical protein
MGQQHEGDIEVLRQATRPKEETIFSTDGMVRAAK